MLKGGYWLKPPTGDAGMAIVFSGAIAPEALAAWGVLAEDVPGLGLLSATSPDLLHRGWSARQAARWTGSPPSPATSRRCYPRCRPAQGSSRSSMDRLRPCRGWAVFAACGSARSEPIDSAGPVT